MTRRQFSRLGGEVLWVAVIFGLARLSVLWLAVAVLVIREVVRRRSASDWTLDKLSRSAPEWVFGMSMAVLIALAPKGIMAGALAVIYVLWLGWLRLVVDRQKPFTAAAVLFQAGVTQFVGASSVFVAATIWGWSTALVMALLWLVSFLAADGFLVTRAERSRAILSAAWALIASELAWLFSVWRVSYVLFGGYLIIPQAALVLTALGYCFGGIYVSHREGRLSRSRLIEYIAIGLVLLAIVIAGTKWSAAV